MSNTKETKKKEKKEKKQVSVFETLAKVNLIILAFMGILLLNMFAFASLALSLRKEKESKVKLCTA